MYLNFFQLNKKPFSLAPDPEFLYLSQQHKDALGAIIYGIEERAGFVSVVGEVGTGKTTIVRSYLHKVGRNKVTPIFIFNSRITFRELMKTFLYEIGIKTEVLQKIQNMNDLVRLAYKAMLEKTKQGKNIVLIIDEAQNMPIETLGRLCILSNFETAKAKLVQIVLVGQPELQKKLDLHELRQLRQRIAHRAIITPLSTKDSLDYIKHRVSLSTRSKLSSLFTTSAARQIVKHSKGVPRVINVLCENSLVAGYGLQKKPVTLKVVKQVISEYEGRSLSRHLQMNNVVAVVLFLLVFTLLAGPYLTTFSSTEEAAHKQAQLQIKPKPNLMPVVSKQMVVTSEEQDSDNTKSQDHALTRNELTSLGDEVSKPTTIPEADHRLQTTGPIVVTIAPDVSVTEPPARPSENKYKLQEKGVLIVPEPPRESMISQHFPHLKVAKRGDTVSRLCLEAYGFVNTRLLVWLKGHNPHIPNLDQIQINEVIFFPEMEIQALLNIPNRFSGHSSVKREEVVSR